MKWIKKHVSFDLYKRFSNVLVFSEIFIEKSFEGYTFQFVFLNVGFSVTYHTEKALKWLKEMKKAEKELLKNAKPIKSKKLVKEIMKDYGQTFKELKKSDEGRK